MIRVAALFVANNGPYFGLSDVDPWDEKRDARTYAGPWPVVAHPPCAAWSRMAGLREYVHGLPRGEDGGKFKSALASVRKWGGVLEHPASSTAWHVFGLARPLRGCWIASGRGWVTEVSQVAYGHPARKRTWLYCFGCAPPELNWAEPQARGVMVAGNSTTRTGEISKRARDETPNAFRDLLLDLARSVSLRP